jgi:hypothetical protein
MVGYLTCGFFDGITKYGEGGDYGLIPKDMTSLPMSNSLDLGFFGRITETGKQMAKDVISAPLMDAWDNHIKQDVTKLFKEDLPRSLKDKLMPLAIGGGMAAAVGPTLINQFIPQNTYSPNKNQEMQNGGGGINDYPDSIESPNDALRFKAAPSGG